MNYIEPQKDKSFFTCPHCKIVSYMEYAKHHFQSDFALKKFMNILTIARCINCGKKILWIDDEYIYPQKQAIEPNEDMPSSVKSLFEEAGNIYALSPRAACALLRLAIDKLCNELGANDRDINKNIGELVSKGLPLKIQQALDVVRVVGNKAVHPGTIAFDVDDEHTAIMLMNLINMIVEYMISQPKQINEMFNQLPDSVKKSISKRDSLE